MKLVHNTLGDWFCILIVKVHKPNVSRQKTTNFRRLLNQPLSQPHHGGGRGDVGYSAFSLPEGYCIHNHINENAGVHKAFMEYSLVHSMFILMLWP